MSEAEGTRSNPDTPEKAQDGEKKMKQRGSPLFPDEGVITLRVESNPKRPGSKAHERWNYKNGMTVKEALEAGTRYDDLKWDTDHEFIAVNETPEMRAKYEAQAKEKAEAKAVKEKEKAERKEAREKAKTAKAEEKAKKAAEKKAAADAKAAAKAAKGEGEGTRAQA